jgi:phenolic acid decarboxylase
MDFLCTIYWNSSDHYFFDRLSALNSRHKEDARLDKQGPRVIYAEKIGAWYVKDLAVKIDQKSGVQELSWTEPAGMRISSSETLEAQTLGKPIRRQMTMHPFE